MPRHVAFLRAINVGGHVVKMDRLRVLFGELGLANVETFIASGNVLFDSTARSAALESRIEKHLEQALGYEVLTFVRPLAALAEVLDSHPYHDENAAGCALQVGFLKAPASSAVQQALKALQTDTDEFHFAGREVYWLCRTRTSDSKFSGPLFERSLGARATFRNVNTVRKLAARL
ncbi:MAG: uncharacterized protein JWM95_4168 [Gemmatimonadetes bacterium]|nr:uncharacterized protein [Gemmatimonadota bacterium]